jgi:serine/threonine protein kinase
MGVSKNGTIIDRRFRIDALVGAGGFGHVFKAQDQSLNRTVAVKVLDVVDPSDVDAQARFEREAKVLSSLQHPHIVTVYNYGADENGRPYISMQYLEGETLRDVIRVGKMSWQRAASIFIQICEALTAAHRAGIIHRDLKPENIILLNEPESDYVKVLDFGLSGYVFGAEGAVQRLTRTGALVGTALYMSPEVCQGERADERSDIYSLGCVLYECLLGMPPFAAEDPLQLLYKHLHDMPKRMNASNSVPSAMEMICFKAMQKKPADRFQSMDEFAEALNAVRTGQANPTIGSVQFEIKAKKKNLVLPAACSIIAVMAVTVGISIWYFDQPSTTTWTTEQDLANVLWTKHDSNEAMEHYRKALKHAATKEQRYYSELQLGKCWIEAIHLDPKNSEKIPMLEAAVRDASDETQSNIARTLLGIAYYDDGRTKEAKEILRDEPWKSLRRAKDHSLTGELWVMRAVTAHSGFARAGAANPYFLRDFDPESRELYVDTGFWNMVSTIRTRGLDGKVPQVDLVAVITDLRRGVNREGTMPSALRQGQSLLERSPDNLRLQILLRSLMGVACYYTNDYDKAVELLESQPWLQGEAADRNGHWCYDARLALAISYLLRNNPDQAKAAPILEELASNKEYNASIDQQHLRAELFNALVLLDTGDVSKRADVHATLMRTVAMRGMILDRAESDYVKAALQKHNMMDVWRRDTTRKRKKQR